MTTQEEFIQDWINTIIQESLIILDEDDNISMHVHNRLTNNLMRIEILIRKG